MALELFGYEFTNVPECLYDPNKNKPFKNKKSSLKDMLSKDSPGVAYNLFKDGYESKSLVVDLSTIIRSFGPRYKDRTDVTFEDFTSVIIDHILQMNTNMEDLYENMSIKGLSETAPRTVFESTSFLPTFLKIPKIKLN